MVLYRYSIKATYIRLIETAYTEISKPPDSCNRDVQGSLTYQVIGWHYNQTTIEGLLPATVINLVSFVLLLVAVFIRDRVVYPQGPTDMNLLHHSLAEGGNGQVEDSPAIYSPPANHLSVQVDDEKVVPVLPA
jgi:hypothetical protein